MDAGQRQQCRGKHRRQHVDQRVGERTKAAGFLVMSFGRQQTDGYIRGGLLHGVHQSVQCVETVQVPDLQPSGLKQYQHSDRAQCSKAVTGQHNGLFVPTVAQSACENAHHNIGRIGTYGQKRCGECRALRLVRPDDEGEIRHCAAQCGKGLGQPIRSKSRAAL